MSKKDAAAEGLHLAIHCTTGTVWTGTDFAERDAVFAEAVAQQVAEADAFLAEQQRAQAARHAEQARLNELARHADARRREAFDRLAASHPEVAELIKQILT